MAFVDTFQKQIWESKYQYKNESFKGFCERIGDNIFPNDEKHREELIGYLKNFEVLFGGRINANIGVDEDGLTLFNCYIMSTGVKDIDSLEGILDLAKDYALTLKSEGGVGFCANFLRPAKTIIRKIGVSTPGSVKFLEIYDKLSEVITSGSVDKDDSYQGVPTKSSIRKGATMITMSLCHPDIEEFITAKSTPNRLSKMNMSVLVNDAFMYAVENNLDWDLWFPDINFEKYKTEWDGDFERWAEKGYPFLVYKTVKARDLWGLLLKNTYNRNEPGILFIDTIRKYNNVAYLTGCGINSTNPCGEVFGATGFVKYNGNIIKIGDVCDLGSVNVTRFYDMKTGQFDFESFGKRVALMVRCLDRIIDISNYPLQQYEDSAKLRRKIGVGLAGIGSLFMMMNIRYGSPESIEFLENQLLPYFMNELYRASALLAKELGPFELYSKKLLKSGYLNLGILDKEVVDLIKEYGLRNSALSAIAPNGTLSILAGNISGGIEPVFSKEFYRWVRIEGRKVDFDYPNIHKGEWFETDYFKETNAGDEIVLISKDEQYRIDKNTGLCGKVLIQDYGYKLAEKFGFDAVAGATELSIDEHLEVLRVVSKYIDLSVSKTINIPADTTFEEFKKLYGKIYDYGIKGCTTYREDSSAAVLENVKKEKEKSIKKQQKEFLDSFKNQNGSVVVELDVKLPEQYPAVGYILKSEGKKWYLHVCFKDKECTKPFAIFVNTNHKEDNTPTFNALEKLEDLAVYKGLKTEYIELTKQKYAYQKNPVKICRMLGLLLRHNVAVYDVVKALDGVDEAVVGTFVFRIKKFLAQFVQEDDIEVAVCPSCKEKALVFQEGCFLCNSCGHSKCS